MESAAQKKGRLREELRRDRELRFTPESWLHLLQTSELREAKIIASYHSYGFEPETKDLNEEIIRRGKILLLPRTLPDNDIEWVIWNGNASNLKRRGKTQEPIGPKYINEHLIDVVIVPALAIDPFGNRMGQGGGSYDRALSRTQAWKVGIVGAAELIHQNLPTEPHDQPLNAAATPTLLVRFNQDDLSRP